MKIQYRTELVDGKADEYRVVFEDAACCCDMMDKVWGDDFVVDDDWNGTGQVQLHLARPSYGCTDWESIPVSFCPFCGEAFTYEVTRIVNIRKKVTEKTVTHSHTEYEAYD